jgi:tetratricopeptide (TPR) repeat protein
MLRIALTLIVCLAAVDTAAQPAPVGRVRKTLVMPFENVTRESRIVWLGEAASVLLADDLAALGVDAISGEDRREAFERLQVPPANALTDATCIRIGELIGASEIVVGTQRLQGETILVRARTIVLETGKVRVDVTEAGPFVDFFAILERIARRIAPPSSRSRDEMLHAHPPVAAFENYIKGLLAETPATAINYLNAALKVQSSFDRVRLALWRVYTDQGEHDRALAAIRPIPARSPWAGRAGFLSGLSQIELKRYDEAFATFKRLGETTPGAAAVLNNLGVVQVRRGSTPQTGEAVYYFTRAAEEDPAGADYFFNLGYAYWLVRDTQAAIYWLREAVRRDPTDGEAHFVLSAALAAAGSAAESGRERELARRLTPAFEEWATRPPADPVPRGLERIRTSLEESFAQRTDEALASTGQRDQLELVQFHLDRGRRLFEQENDREALAELSRAVFLSPYEAEAHLLIGRLYLRGGRVADAIDSLKISLWSAETAEAHEVLAEAYLAAREQALAEAEASRALALDPASVDAAQILERARAVPAR